MSDLNHRLITQGRIIKAGCQNFVRNLTLAIAAMAVMVITLTIILFSVVANATFANTIQGLNDKIDISVYLKDDVTDEERDKLIEDTKNIQNVRSVEYVSKDQALEDYKKANANNLDLLLAISQTDNPLPASLRVKPRDVNKIDEIKAFLDRGDIKALQSDETSYSGERQVAIDKITAATSFFQKAGAIGVLVFALVSMLIIFNTIRMTIFNRRDELQIMRLLGASTSYIRGPFIVETVIYGIIAALLSVSLCETIFNGASYALDESSLLVFDITFANDYFAKNFWLILTVQLAIGILIGAVSSIIATRRYLKFKTTK
ncbi:ABC transporter permease [Candidatus Saccharibacteria bacterium]|nr:ABC transporter permease [Candidatus Saccharibacteria bacterium]